MATATTLQAPPPLPHHRQEASVAIIANVTAHARDVERRWGTGLLPRLMPIDLMEKFNRQRRLFDQACLDFDHDAIKRHGEAMLRAYDKLEETASLAGYLPAPPPQWEFTLPNGELVVLVRDRHELAQIDLKGRKAQVWSLEEISEVIGKFPELCRAKDAFPGAEVVRLMPSKAAVDALDDSLADVPWD